MGYFSEWNGAIQRREAHTDRSCPSFEEQLRWRYDKLKEQYERLLASDAPCVGDDWFSRDDYRYAPVACFSTLWDVACALEIAKDELWETCGIDVDGEQEDGEDPEQIAIEFVYLPSWLQTAAAAAAA